jgi:hypothetical protein
VFFYWFKLSSLFIVPTGFDRVYCLTKLLIYWYYWFTGITGLLVLFFYWFELNLMFLPVLIAFIVSQIYWFIGITGLLVLLVYWYHLFTGLN